MYLSLIVKFLGDKFTLWLCKIPIVIISHLVTMLLFAIPVILEKRASAAAAENQENNGETNRMTVMRDKVKGILSKIWMHIPKYSDLQKKHN